VSQWVTVLAACGAAYLLKLAGHLVPDRWLSGMRVRRVTGLLPVALLTALVVVQTFASTGHGLTVAVVALLLRAPFIVVVLLAALTAAGLRHLGWG